MDLFKQGMRGPMKPAPTVPKFGVNRYSPVTDWNDDPFGADVFEPMPQQKKKPPPRPPPPKLPPKRQPDVPAKPSHFNRKPTVLTALLSSKRSKQPEAPTKIVSHQQNSITDFSGEGNANKLFPKCEPKNIQTEALIDLSSPPSSPTFTTRSSSDGLSVDSFGSDATTSTNHRHTGNISQTESGFEDDFDLFLSRNKDETDDMPAVDPFSPPVQKPPIMKKPILNKDYMDLLCDFKTPQLPLSAQTAPTIIRAKPARPKPPENSAILKSTFGNTLPVAMNLNTRTPIQKIGSSFDSFESKELNWDDDDSDDREPSPPMPTIPPPPPPLEVLSMEGNEPGIWDDLIEPVLNDIGSLKEDVPYGVALYDYNTEHPDDLVFNANTRIELVRRVNEEWLVGRTGNGSEGLFPSNYIEIKVPLPNDAAPSPKALGTGLVLYNFDSNESGDLRLREGDRVKILSKINDEWYYGECNGVKGQFPGNYVDMNVL